MSNPSLQTALDRRQWLGQASRGLGAAALAALLGPEVSAAEPAANSASSPAERSSANHSPAGLLGLPHHPPRAKRVVFLCQSGAPSQIDLFDPKPELDRRHGDEIPDSIRRGQRLTTMTSEQATLPLARSLFRFARHGQCGADVSELLPHTARIVDDLCFVRSLHTDAINHDPAITFLQTGSEQPGRPSMGAWVAYGLGSESRDLPEFVVFVSGGVAGDQPLYDRLWGAGFLPARHQGVKFRGGAEPMLYLADPPGIDRATRRRMLDAQAALAGIEFDRFADPEISARVAQYELAFRMQQAIPRLADLSDESERTFELYGNEARQPGTYAANCLLARRLLEQGVRFVQLYHRGWDHHSNLPSRIRGKCRQTDQASAALVADLKQRGLLDDTLVVWAGEFGRTAYCQGELTADNYGRDHHPRCFTVWLSGGGVRSGFTFGRTDDFSYNVAEHPVHVHDLQATILHLLGIDHERLTYRFQSRDFRLTDIAGQVVRDILI
ncbi:MAG: DUF1501 domain-containing protein [Pirellulaceae bacterium]